LGTFVATSFLGWPEDKEESKEIGMRHLMDNSTHNGEQTRTRDGSRRLDNSISEALAGKKFDKEEPHELCEEDKKDVRSGAEAFLHEKLQYSLGNTVVVFMSMLALLAMAAAGITAYETVIHDFPKLWQQINEYNALQQVIQNLLLIAIAAELGMLLLFHRTTAAVEVIIFVIARKMLTPDISVTGLALCTASIVGLVIMRFHYLPGNSD